MSNNEKIEIIRQVAEKTDSDVYEAYSSRGMYGQECWGISTHDPDLVKEEAVILGLRGACEDSLGKGYIVYWPSVKFEQKEVV